MTCRNIALTLGDPRTVSEYGKRRVKTAEIKSTNLEWKVQGVFCVFPAIPSIRQKRHMLNVVRRYFPLYKSSYAFFNLNIFCHRF